MRRPAISIRASTAVKLGDFRCYSNTSDDALGLSGAFADIGSSLSQAKNAILITSWLFSPSLHLPFFHEQLREALQFHEKSNLVGAKVKYAEVIATFLETTIENQYAHYFLCIAALQENDIEESDRQLQWCLSRAPHNMQFHNTALYFLLLQNKLTEAKIKADAIAALPSEKTDARFWTLYGDIAFALGDIIAAKNHYQYALEKQDVQCIAAKIGLGKVCLQSNDTVAAIEQFTSVLAYFPNDPTANYYLADIFLKQNRVEEAIQHAMRVSDTNRQGTSLQTVYAMAACQHYFSDRLNKPNRLERIEHCLQLINDAIQKDQANFSLLYYGSLLYLEKNEIEHAKKILARCAEVNPEKLKRVLEGDAAKWVDVDLKALNLENKITLFQYSVPADASLEEKIVAYQELIKQFPYCRDFRFALADCYAVQGDYTKALDEFCMAGDLHPFDSFYLKRIIQKISDLPLDNDADKLFCAKSIVLYQKEGYQLQTHFNFYDAYAAFREQLPTLGELLVKKAHDNPHMVVALQVWNRSQPNDRHYVSGLQADFKRIAEKMGLDAVPHNVLLRFTNTEGVAYTHHQKYIVIDRGSAYPTAFYGSCDLALGKFDWSAHPLVNTEENNGAVSHAHGFNHAENMNCASESKLKLPWREVVSRADGPIAIDFVTAFEDRWRALGHGTLRGARGAENQHLVAAYAVAVKSREIPQQVPDDDSSVVQFEADIIVPDHYSWHAQLLQSTKQNYSPTNPGFFKARAVESSVQDAMIAAISKAENYIYIETQYFTDQKIADALISRIQDKHMRSESFHVYTVLPFSPNGNPGGRLFVEPVRELQWELMQRCMQSVEDRTQKPWNTYLSFLFFGQWGGVSYQLNTLHTDGKPHNHSELLNESYRHPIYIHSKLMVIDDQIIINGSANLNERSLSGDGDTEIAVMQMPKPGCEAECRRDVSAFMREKILTPYFGESTIAALDAVSMRRPEKNNMIFTNSTMITAGRITTRNIVLNDHVEFTYRIDSKKEVMLASLDTTPQKLWNAFVDLVHRSSLAGKDKRYFDQLVAGTYTATQKLLRAIEYVRENPKTSFAHCYSLAFYQLYKAQLYSPGNTVNPIVALQVLSDYFRVSRQDVDASDFLSRKLIQETTATVSTAVTRSETLHLGSPDVVRHIQRIGRENYDDYASNEMGHGCTPQNGKVIAFPFKADVCGQVGRLRAGCERIPDAPIDATGKVDAAWCWIPSRTSFVLSAATVMGYKGLK